MTTPRILVLDIETSPILAHVWGIWQQNVGLNMIKAEWCILSYCAKWLGDDRIIYADNSKQKNKEDDRRLLVHLWKLLDKADMVIAHNGKKFDMRKIQARFLLNGMPPPSPVKVIDTLLEARRHFAMTSQKLEFLTDKLCTKHKKLKHAKFAGFALWRECLAGNQEAWAEMKEYNIADVLSLEELYYILRPWMTGHPNVGAYNPDETTDAAKCPACGSLDVIRKGQRYTQVGQYTRYLCKCGHWSRGRLMTNTKEARKNLLVS
jgi:predicted RNA-binding Zn-ribbon protein involved in translation (DUF1610 family)